MMVKIGIIGGSGLDNPAILQDARDVVVDTPYGKPSSAVKAGKIQGIEVLLLARHGHDHSIMPSSINNQANIWALKELGCTHILASTACGSLKEQIKPGDFVMVDQFIDHTTKRKQTFYEQNQVCHIPMADPFCPKLRQVLIQSAEELRYPHHRSGTVITVEGPRFSSRAESKMFQQWGADIINMSTVPEAVLAREAGICYTAIAMATDYDCWRSSTERVSWEEVVQVFHRNVEKIINLFCTTIPKISQVPCQCQEDIKTAIMSKSNTHPGNLKEKIRSIPNWPKPGIMFRDITPLFKDADAFHSVIQQFAQYYKNKSISKIIGIESRGFILGAALAYELNLPFVLIRKIGKLPAETIQQEYELEYGKGILEIHKDAITPGDQVLIVDDLLATGGTALASCQLIEKLGGKVMGLAFVITLPDLRGKEKLRRYDLFHLIKFEGE